MSKLLGKITRAPIAIVYVGSNFTVIAIISFISKKKSIYFSSSSRSFRRILISTGQAASTRQHSLVFLSIATYYSPKGFSFVVNQNTLRGVLKPLPSTVGPILTREVPMYGLRDSVVSPFLLCLSDLRPLAHDVLNRVSFLIAQTTQQALLCLNGLGHYSINSKSLTLGSHQKPFRLFLQISFPQPRSTSCSHWLSHPYPSEIAHLAFYSSPAAFSLSFFAFLS